MNPPQKIGVLTFHRCINYGSYWQARCLANGLRARGGDAEILDFDSRRANFAEWKCALQPTLPTPAPRADRALYRRKICRFFAAFDQLPLSPRFDLDDAATMPLCDTLVVGSDEVWNLVHPWFGQKPLFYGLGARASKLVAYAASFGNYDQSAGLHPYWADALRAFDFIAVRDRNSREILRNALGWEPPLVLDPCLQWPDLIRPAADARVWDGEYLAVYGHNFSDAFIENARRAAQMRALPLVSIGYRNAWAHENWLDAGPHEFARFVAGATGVLTNFFHGCVFALLQGKPLACEVTNYRSIKITDLLASVGDPARLTGASTASARFAALLDTPIEAPVTANIARLRAASRAYLDEALA